ncbi:hypothetical protein [Fulvivirga ligni]|uniref:hypothetical protein n=1 Tax=Fulvivirga ligni TaxID=2904246 RepID=UPI001F4318C3|nr:hypothetical protein [Fulvivirga ligni]UII20539.1 hypothetical protein LVD16_22115 [Fulvivirga ligni]
MRTKENKIEWTGKIKDKVFSDILFEELVVRKADLEKVEFKNVHFKNSYLGFDTKFLECVFIDCKFYGKYSSLGKPAKYIDCRFENCEFVGTDLFMGQYFHNCFMSGLMKNPILNDEHSKIHNNETVFKNCDLTDLTFDNVTIYGKEVFDNCKLPNSGIRLFDNLNDKLITRAEQICEDLNTDDKIESEMIFKRDLKTGQNPLILDNLFLESFFKTVNSRKIFEEIINGYEIK